MSTPLSDWMESFESIQAAAAPARRGIAALLDRNGNHAVRISSRGTFVQDLAGLVYFWFDRPQALGSIASRSISCDLHGAAPQMADIRVKVIRRAAFGEVKELWAKSECRPKIPLRRGGHWYEVHTD
jgi:hypothetical protein